MALINHNFRKYESGIFFTQGLDRANQLDRANEIRFCAQAVFVTYNRAAERHREATRSSAALRVWIASAQRRLAMTWIMQDA